MKKIIGVALLCAFSSANAADSNASIIQTCQGLKRQSDRNKCLEEAFKSASITKPMVAVASLPEKSKRDIASKRAEQVFSYAQEIQSVIGLGVSYNDYSPYIQKFAIAVDQYKSAAELPEEKDAAAFLVNAIDAYRDAREYWGADIRFYSNSDNYTSYPGGLPSQLAGTGHILNKYQIPISKSDFWGLFEGARRDLALTTIWQFAKDATSSAKGAIDKIDSIHTQPE